MRATGASTGCEQVLKRKEEADRDETQLATTGARAGIANCQEYLS